MNRPKAVLFDFDGVLADTANVHIAAWERTFGEIGWDVDPDTCARAAEEDDRSFLADIFAGRGVEEGDLEGWVRRKQARTRQLLRDAPPMAAGADRLIDALRGRVRLAVVSTTWRENVEAVLGPSGLLDAFERIIAKEDVRATKPDPEPYRKALRALGLRAPDAVALEDSRAGLESARGAKVRVVLVGRRWAEGDAPSGAPVVPDLSETDRVLDALGGF